MSKKHEHCHDEKENKISCECSDHCHSHMNKCEEKHHGHDHDHEHDHEHACACGHEHGEERRSPKSLIVRYAVGALPIVLSFLPFVPATLRIIAAVLGYAVFGIEVWVEMIKGFGKRKIFTEFTLMCAATVGAFAIGEYADAAAVMYLYSLGETVSESAYSRSKKSISELLLITPEYANVIREGEILRVAPENVEVGECVLVVTGERIPLDAVTVEGGGEADTSSVTGESVPLSLYDGVACPSGSILTSGSVKMRVTATYENSIVSKLARAVSEASRRKSATEKKISRLAKILTPAAFALAFLITLVGTLVSGDLREWLHAGLVVLVVSCPCSLVLSVPLTYFAGIGAAASRGIVFRGGETMDSMSRLRGLAFDKTGTLTESHTRFVGVELFGSLGEREFISLAYDVLTYSPHACAVSFCNEYKSESVHTVTNVQNIGGRGIVCEVDGESAFFGNAALMRERGIEIEDSRTTAIFGAYRGELLGKLNFSSRTKSGAAEALKQIREYSITDLCVISGDGEAAVADVCGELDIDEYYFSVTPDAKAEKFMSFSERVRKAKKGTVGFCGDGLNDSAVISMADVGIAMGDGGASLTVESADVVLMDGSISKICEAVRISKATSKIATQNIIISLGIKVCVLAVGVAMASSGGGEIPMELAIIADVGAAVIAVLNALRASRIKRYTK